MKDLFIPVILGTVRKERKSIHVAKLVADVGNKIPGIKTELVDPADFNFSSEGPKDNSDPRYSKITKEANGFFIVTPEYNHSFPGSLKRLLDSEYDNYKNKAVAFASVSAGPWGGVRAVESLLPVVKALGLVTSRTDVQFPNISKIFNKKGELQDENYIRRVEKVFRELVWNVRAMKWGCENLKQD